MNLIQTNKHAVSSTHSRLCMRALLSYTLSRQHVNTNCEWSERMSSWWFYDFRPSLVLPSVANVVTFSTFLIKIIFIPWNIWASIMHRVFSKNKNTFKYGHIETMNVADEWFLTSCTVSKDRHIMAPGAGSCILHLRPHSDINIFTILLYLFFFNFMQKFTQYRKKRRSQTFQLI